MADLGIIQSKCHVYLDLGTQVDVEGGLYGHLLVLATAG